MKRVISLVAIFLILFGLVGCMKTKRIMQKHCVSYLKNKYNTEFSFVSDGDDDGWPSHWRRFIYEDNQNHKFTIEMGNNSIHDNYCASLFDNIIQNALQKELGSSYRVFVSSLDSFFGEDGRFSDYNDYIAACPYIRVFILIDQDQNMNTAVQEIQKISVQTKYYITIYKTNKHTESVVNDFDAAMRIQSKDIIETESLTLDIK